MRRVAIPAAVVALFALAGCGGSDEEEAALPPELIVRIDGPAIANFGETLLLNGSGSRGSGALAFEWTIEGPAADAAIPEPRDLPELSLYPDLVGRWVVTLQVRDGLGRVKSTSLAIRVGSTPIADPGRDQVVFVGDTVRLDGSASRDPAGLPLSYRWIVERQPGQPSDDQEETPPPLPPDPEDPSDPEPLEVEGEDTAFASFVAGRQGIYELTLRVDNGITSTRSRRLTIVALE